MIKTIVAALCVGIVAVACIWGYRLDHSTGNKENTETTENASSASANTSEGK